MIKGLIVSSQCLCLFFALCLSPSEAQEVIRNYHILSSDKNLDVIAKKFEIVKKDHAGFEVYVPEELVQNFLKLSPHATLLEKNIHGQSLEQKTQGASQYRKFSDVENDLKKLALKYKDIVSLETYGQSKAGRLLYSLRVSTAPEANHPKLLITAATHGDELITTEVLFILLNELLEGAQTNSRLAKILNSRDIYFIPVVSPDSFENRERYVGGKDPNRSFPWPQNINNRGVDVIDALINYTDKMKFNGSLDLHAYGKLVMYPWGYTKKTPDAADEVVFSDLVQSMARDNQYKAGQISTTIYVAQGSSADYFYWKSKTRAIAAELGTQKIPDYSRIPLIANEAREMVWTFLEYFN